MEDEGNPSQTNQTKRRQMRYSDEDDKMLLRQVLSDNPYQDSKNWKLMLDALTKEMPGKPFTIKNMRERVNLLIEQFKQRDTAEIYKSGVEPPAPSEKEILVEEVKDLKVSFTTKPTKKDSAKKRDVGLEIRQASAEEHLEELQGELLIEEPCEIDVVDEWNEERIADGMQEVAALQENSTPEEQPLAPVEVVTVPSTSTASNSTPTFSEVVPERDQRNSRAGPTPTKRRKRAVTTSNIAQYLKVKRDTEREIKLKTLEVELLKEQNESRRIALQEQQMSAVIASLNNSVGVMKEVLGTFSTLHRAQTNQHIP